MFANWRDRKKEEKLEMKYFDIWKLERKKNEEIKGRISRQSLVLFHI